MWRYLLLCSAVLILLIASSLPKHSNVIMMSERAVVSDIGNIPTLQFPSRLPGPLASKKHGRTSKLGYEDPYHHEPYDKKMELQEWSKMAKSFRLSHPGLDPKQEQAALDTLWRDVHPYFYHAYGPKRRAGESEQDGDMNEEQVDNYHDATTGKSSAGNVANVGGYSMENVPATVLAPPDDGVRDFNGQTAVIARLPNLGHGRTALDEFHKEARGSFAVRVFGASGQPEIEVTRPWSGMAGPFRCTYRGYRHLKQDFSGTAVATGFKRVFLSQGGRILTGMTISPSGNPDEFDVMTCRDSLTGEVQYFKLHPELVLSRMREMYCNGDIPSGSIGGCGF
ncbi:hypothetical protein GUITHDRAFT_133642 [Guillardia theta CCMP2712]|uniref:Uncharacterized protein n=1 Tax=Guillardia theta (strain CCMP2712) TaxID=905079 RepID=L1JWU6_GUITC|nr:hypothetical protein GUITHDRAFT_133642 [Guillardia theta CCMP2712]EKX52583.1 hypothetical protein GUITHDRAFT_133642 [Guillardia theta CCMP2712]|eukprot:XP_005839563.1 hypothetical protein GUITHDRAFT_133642 [Guillardia theta CCMP2712]